MRMMIKDSIKVDPQRFKSTEKDLDYVYEYSEVPMIVNFSKVKSGCSRKELASFVFDVPARAVACRA